MKVAIKRLLFINGTTISFILFGVMLLLLLNAQVYASNVDESFEYSFCGSFNEPPGDVVVQPDGKILITSSSYGGDLYRLNVDGSLDSSFTLPDINGGISSISLQPDGGIIAGGSFDLVDGVQRTGVVRFNSDGSMDTSFNPPVFLSAVDDAGSIDETLIQPDGKILVSGSLRYVNGVRNERRIFRLNANGSLDESYVSDLKQPVESMALQEDEMLVVGTIANFANDSLQRFNANGSKDTKFNPTINGRVLAIHIQDDGQILIGGNFTEVVASSSGLILDGSRNHIARLDKNGRLDLNFNPGAGEPDMFGSNVYSITQQSDGKILFGGDFTYAANAPFFNLARVNSVGSADISLRITPNRPVQKIIPYADDKFLIGGSFTEISGLSRRCLARIENTLPSEANGSLCLPVVSKNKSSAFVCL